MIQNNKELRRSIAAIAIVTVVLAVVGFAISTTCGVLVLVACIAIAEIHIGTEIYRYRRLQKLSQDLDCLLISGTPLPITEYNEGELSILATQVQKLGKNQSVLMGTALRTKSTGIFCYILIVGLFRFFCFIATF